jgi:hypothetical protein
MKYYLYISDAKVDMLLPQIPHEAKKKVSLEVGVDLKLLKATRKSETESDESRISRLETVVTFINKYGRVGSLDNPDDFIYDTQPMCLGPFRAERIAYFTGKTQRTTFALAGSASHLIGESPAQRDWEKFSGVGAIFHWLRQVAPSPTENMDALGAISMLADEAESSQRRPQQTLECFAKRLIWKSCGKGRNIFLGTPLYVAMSD